MTDNVSLKTGKTSSSNSVTTNSQTSAKISDALKKMAASAKTTSLDKTKLANLNQLDLQKELEQLQVERKLDVEKIEKYEAEVQKLADEASKMIKEAIKEQDKTVKEHEEKTQNAINSEIQKYIAANKNKEGSMSKSQLASNISSAIGNPNLSKSLEKLLTANQNIAEIDNYLSQINSLSLEIEGLDLSIKNTNAAIAEAQKQAEAQKAAEEAKCCDPIGFNLAKNGAKFQYDFIVDDGNFDSTGDFLGATNQWEAMKALDTDGDGVVNAKELKAGNIKAVRTDASGNKKVVDLAEEFGDDFKVNLNSYKSGGKFDGIDSTKDADGNGIVDQKLMGTFNVSIGGKEVQGYNTLDDVEYLKSAYGVKSDATGEAGGATEYKNFFITYSKKSEELKTELADAMKNNGISENNMKVLEEAAKLDANSQAKVFDTKLKKEIDTEERKKLEAEAEAKIQKQIDEQKKAEEAKAKQKASANANSDDNNEEDDEEKKKSNK